MKTLAKILSYLVPVRKYRKPFLHWLEEVLWCGAYHNVYVWKIRRMQKRWGGICMSQGQARSTAGRFWATMCACTE